MADTDLIDFTLGRQLRDIHGAQIRIAKRDDGGTTLTFPLSSEAPVERWYGTEILSHDTGAIRLDRANGGAMPLLFNHHLDDPIGMVDAARIEGRRLVVDAHLFATARAMEVAAMLDGGLRNVSIGYQVNTFEQKVKEDVYTATDWEPYEGSIVTVPADPSVGISRADDPTARPVRIVRTLTGTSLPSQPAAPAALTRSPQMGDTTNATAGAIAETATGNDAMSALHTTARVPALLLHGPSAIELEADRRTSIENLCAANNIDNGIRTMWISSGAAMKQVSSDILQIIEARATNTQKVTQIGLTDRETRRFSLCRAIEACGSQNWTNAGFEAEASRAVQQKLNRTPDPNRFFVPWEVQERANMTPVEAVAYSFMKRDLTAAVAGAGGYLVETTNIGFIELLRNKSVLYSMGALRLSGLQGNITIPKQSATGSATWLANEASSITEINQTFVQVALSPKNVGGYTEMSRQLLLQSNPSIEGLVMTDLASVVALDIDAKGLNGSGAGGQPTGILNTAGVGSVTGAALDYADIVEFQTDVFGGNALTPNAGYVTTGAVAGLLKARVKFASTASPIWDGRLDMADVDGYRSIASNQMPAATMLFGDFGLGVVIGEWGVLEVEVNPFANFQAGIIGVRAIASVDIGVRYPTAFSAAASIT